ncbi:glycoside hydrolase family 95 protein [Pedobacter aquae]|uniref:Glycoside hydrolase family 95 protein n=1 Tax=Pedobacter aquae TaxID=2605747 RepID=A0A5C0VI21_9SPHI|nr:glycoside hydrolase N-terminal domain-containing protein [Pedobacter aquae]QEK50870.1 glycoside hydrolase family 95 protein [Pedobacter aquae]
MKNVILKYCFLLGMMASQVAYAQQSQQLWYKQAAAKWTDALPIGNGRLGAMIFAGVTEDHIQFNEETLWTGQPRNYNREGAAAYLPKIRQLLADGKQKEAEDLAAQHFMGLKSKEGDKASWTKAVSTQKSFAEVNFNDSQWKTFPVPTYEGWESAGLEGLDGALWFRTTFTVPENIVNKKLVLDLNRIRNYDLTYINGKLIGSTEGDGARKYRIPAGLLKVGKNTIAVQVLNYYDKGGIAGFKDTSRHIGIYPEGQSIKEGISLNGNWKYFVQDDNPPEVAQFQAAYQPFGDIYLRFKGHEKYQNYRRTLDLETAISTTSYTVNGVDFKREYFASQPDQAVVMRLSANKAKSLNLEAVLASVHQNFSLSKVDNQTIALKVKVKHGALHGESWLKATVKDGIINQKNGKLIISNASEVVLYLVAASNFQNYENVGGNPQLLCQQAMQRLKTKSYQDILSSHLKEYQSYYKAFSIKLGQQDLSYLPTDVRIDKFEEGKDADLAALYVQYGRYLLIASSRPGTQPANLQGIWNDLLSPPWGSKYTTNINAEMNYWPAEVLNLSATHQAFFKMVEELAFRGTETAQKYYGARGWVLHHNTDLWRGTAPINASNHGIWQGGSGWVSSHLYEHYLFTQDKEFLKNKAYPLMKSAAQFYVDVLVKDPKTGWLISTPSNSPENGGLVAGPTMDHQIIRNLFKSCIAAADVLGIDTDFRDTLKQKYLQIAPNQIGKHGQLQEWLQDIDDPQNKHRHVSHLWAVHPGNEINYDETPDLMKAAKQSLIYRGDEGTGWSLAWKINFWARFKDAEHSLKMLKMLIKPAEKGGGAYVNLFDAHPPFQIDGNFGGAAGIAEMLVQSQLNYIDLLPALPAAWSSGEVKGICARGGFELSFSWANGKLKEVKVLSKAGQPCVLKYGNAQMTIHTEIGRTYTLNQDLKPL